MQRARIQHSAYAAHLIHPKTEWPAVGASMYCLGEMAHEHTLSFVLFDVGSALLDSRSQY